MIARSFLIDHITLKESETTMLIRKLLMASTAMMILAPAMVHSADDDGLFSAAMEIGADTGAMKYCEENASSDEDKGKYKLVRLRALDNYNELEGEAKAKALLVRSAAEDNGDYLGKKLTVERCEDIRKILGLKYLGK